jgi:hypothetical protein
VDRVHLVAIRDTGIDGCGSRKDVSCWCGGCEKMTRDPRVEDGPPFDCFGICGNCLEK